MTDDWGFKGMEEAIFSIGIRDIIKGNATRRIEEYFKNKGILPRIFSHGIGYFVDSYGSIKDFVPRGEELDVVQRKMMNSIEAECDVEAFHRNGETIYVFHSRNFSTPQIPNFSIIKEIYEDFFDSLERKAFEEEVKSKELIKRLDYINRRRNYEIDFLNKFEENFIKLLNSLLEKGKYPFLIVEGNNLLLLEDYKNALEKLEKLEKTVENYSNILRIDGSLAASEPIPEYKFLEALDLIKEEINSGNALNLKDYLESMLISRLYSINQDKPRKTSFWVKVAGGALLGILITSGAYALYKYLTRDRKPPEINSVKYEFIPPDKVFVSINATDESGISKVIAEVENKNYSLPMVNGLYSNNITVCNISEIKSLPIKIYAFDESENVAKIDTLIFPKLKEKFLSYVIGKGFSEEIGEKFYEKYTSNVEELFPTLRGFLLKQIKMFSEHPGIFEEINENVSKDKQIEKDKAIVLSKICDLFFDLGYGEKVKVLIPGTGEYREEKIRPETIKVIGNYTLALDRLPRHDNDVLYILLNATQINPDIVDFSPIKFKSVDRNHAYLTPNTPREVWITAEILKRISEEGFDILNHPEMFLGLNGKIVANAWCFFNDSPFFSIADMEKEVNNREINIFDKDVFDAMMLQWDLYSQFTPQLNGSDKLYNRDFPWYDSAQLKALYPDNNELRVALFKLFYLPETTYSMKEGKRVFGIKAAETSLREAAEEYQKIVRLYPNEKIQTKFLGERSPRFFYYDWLDDRWHNGLSNTVSQFVGGWDDSKVQHGPETITYDWIENQNGLDQFLTKNWKYWDLVKFIIGYERWNRKGGAHEAEGIAYIMPEVLRMAGFPTYIILIDPTPLGASSGEWSICLPPYIAEKMKAQFTNSTMLFGPGYDFGLFSCADGLIRERGIDNTTQHNPIDNGILKVFQWLGDKKVYLMKRG